MAAKYLLISFMAVGIMLCPGAASGDSTTSTPSTPPTSETALDFDVKSAEGTETIVKSSPDTLSYVASIAIILAMIGLVVAAYWVGGRSAHVTPIVTSETLPFSAKVVVTLLVLVFAMTHALALVTVFLNTNVVFGSATDYFFYLKPARLVALSHAHLMGIAMMDGTVALLFALTRAGSGLSASLVAMSFLGIFGDIGSWWLIKYYGGGFEILSVASGLFCTMGFLAMSTLLLSAMWGRVKGTQRTSLKVLIVLLSVGSLPSRAEERDYFNRFYQPGPLQRYLMAQKKEAPQAEVGKEEKASGLSLDSPNLEPPPAAGGGGLSAGPFSNIVFGGTLDYRFIVPKEMTEGMFMIHVNELFLTTNIGDHISILAEQLLLTSDLSTTVGQDHGFAYATISNLSFLPEGTALRIGRLRLKYGIDAKLDGPANPLRTPEYKTIGLISDRALEIAGFFGPVEYVAAVSMGPDYVLRDVRGVDGGIAGAIKVDADNRSRPVTIRVGSEFKGRVPNIGVSYYNGKNYRVLAADSFQAGDVMLFGAGVDQYQLIQKERWTLDARWDAWRFKFSGEVTLGRDKDQSGESQVRAYYLRSDFTILPQLLSAQLQYDRFRDGRAQNKEVGSIGVGLTYSLTDQSWLRGFYQANETVFSGRGGGWVSGTQLLLAF